MRGEDGENARAQGGRLVPAGSHFFCYLQERHAKCFVQRCARVSTFVR